MPFLSRLRRPATRQAGAVALTVALAVLMAACGQDYPDSIFHHRTDVNRDVEVLFKILIYAGTAVFIFVEGILVLALIKFRRRPGQPEPKHVHGNTTLEITWTVIPALVLLAIAVPTVRTIFKTQAAARSDALQIEVYGHQWWWEFRYPQYTFTEPGGRVDTLVTANEMYLPIGKTVNFTLKSKDVIHSFWVPALSGKRDVVSNHTNYLWYTPDSTDMGVFNGACAEYCGTSHGNMRFKAFTVSQADFDSWVANQKNMAVGAEPMPAAAAQAAAGAATGASGAAASKMPPPAGGGPARAPSSPATTIPGSGVPNAPGAVNAKVVQAGFISYPREKIPAYAIPQTPIPAGMHYDDALLSAGNAASGAHLVATGMCVACHTIRGVPSMAGVIGPNLTHVGSRTTIGAGLYPNDPQHLARWVKDAPLMKPGILMPALGVGEYDPVQTQSIVKIGFSDQQVADIVAYLQSLK
ncbi:MAG TPA: cytochrome c oxidase subunit II [Gemmatimonadaceae bacterium]|jgi:cytochrome c oxidase subunit 2|nr:cytochrome c oxidase subunit II [Gemmatimonadaceae bacterium]